MFDLCALRGLAAYCVVLDGTPLDTFTLFECYAVSTSTQLLTFEGIVVPSSSRSTAPTFLGLLDPEDPLEYRKLYTSTGQVSSIRI